jgi:hypothetical protein
MSILSYFKKRFNIKSVVAIGEKAIVVRNETTLSDMLMRFGFECVQDEGFKQHMHKNPLNDLAIIIWLSGDEFNFIQIVSNEIVVELGQNWLCRPPAIAIENSKEEKLEFIADMVKSPSEYLDPCKYFNIWNDNVIDAIKYSPRLHKECGLIVSDSPDRFTAFDKYLPEVASQEPETYLKCDSNAALYG